MRQSNTKTNETRHHLPVDLGKLLGWALILIFCLSFWFWIIRALSSDTMPWSRIRQDFQQAISGGAK